MGNLLILSGMIITQKTGVVEKIFENFAGS